MRLCVYGGGRSPRTFPAQTATDRRLAAGNWRQPLPDRYHRTHTGGFNGNPRVLAKPSGGRDRVAISEHDGIVGPERGGGILAMECNERVRWHYGDNRLDR